MDYREKKQLEKDKRINEEKYNKLKEKIKNSDTDLQEAFDTKKTYDKPTPNKDYLGDVSKKTHGPNLPEGGIDVPSETPVNKSKFLQDDNLNEVMGSEIPKKRQGYLNDLKKSLELGDDEMLADLVRNRDPMAVRHELSTALGQHIKQNYDSPLNAFKDKDILATVPIEQSKLPPNIAGQYDLTNNKIYMPKPASELDEKGTGTLVHELGHAKDWLVDKLKGKNLNESDNILKGSGLQAAEEAFSGHHASGFFEKAALQKLLQGGKLAIPALALGSTLYSAGSKASEGDIPGAALKVGEVVDPTGVASAVNSVKDRLNMPTEQGIAASMQDINNNAHTQLGDYSPEDFSQPDNSLDLLKKKLYGK